MAHDQTLEHLEPSNTYVVCVVLMFEVHICAPIVGSLKVVRIIQFGDETKKKKGSGTSSSWKKIQANDGYLLNKHFTSCA